MNMQLNPNNNLVDRDAEKAAIGSMMLKPDLLPITLAELKAEDFFDQVNRNIFRALGESFQEGRHIDHVTLFDKLKELGKLDGDHRKRLIEIASTEFVPGNTHRHIVSKLARSRTLAQDLLRMQIDLQSGVNIDSIIKDFSAAVITASGSAARMTTAEDAYASTILEIEKRAKSELKLAGIPSGFSDIDAFTGGLVKGNLFILAGRPSMGKSTLALNIAENVARQGLVAAFISLEMSVAELTQKLISRAFNIKLGDIRNGNISEEQFANLKTHGSYKKKIPLHLLDRPGLSVAQVAAEAKALKMRGGLNFLVVDYIGLMDSKGQTREQEVASITRGLKRLAMELDVPIMALSQLNRGVEQRTNKRPILSDLRESGAIEQDANVVAFIYQDEKYNSTPDNPQRGIAEVIIAKQRLGPTGTTRLSSSRLEFSEFTPLTNRRS